jgi:hypothetical protein
MYCLSSQQWVWHVHVLREMRIRCRLVGRSLTQESLLLDILVVVVAAVWWGGA